MPASLLLIVTLFVFTAGYLIYGRFLNRVFDVNPSRLTPAHTQKDGMDYVPAKAPVLLGHHFSSIAGAGPILGPVFAALFGWVPVFLWILAGSLFVGGVHDFSTLIASVRHGGKSIGEVIETTIGPVGKRLFLIFAWFTLILVVAVFCKIVATTFESTPEAATSSLLFVGLALIFGLGVYRMHIPLKIATPAGVLLLALCVFLGLQFPLSMPYQTWLYILFAYIFIAAVAPVWILLQPRDFLNSFLLYAILLGGIAGIFVYNPKVTFPAFTAFRTEQGALFPILFVIVACGAISGFHSLVSAGTSSKQLNSESDARLVGYGSMLIEGLLAVVALITATTVAGVVSANYQSWMNETGPINIFSQGIGRFVSSIGIPEEAGITFAALAISAFCLTTLDTATRLARFIFQEFFENRKRPNALSRNRYVGTGITVIVAGLLALTGTSTSLWPLFGSANQLLAAIALLAVTVWLAEKGKKTAFIRIPMIFMFLVTLTALGFLIVKNAAVSNFGLSTIALLLFIVAIFLVVKAWSAIGKRKKTA